MVSLHLKERDRHRTQKFAEFYVRYLQQYVETQRKGKEDWPKIFRAGLLSKSLELRKRSSMIKLDYEEEYQTWDRGFYGQFLDKIQEELPKHDVVYFVVVPDLSVTGQYGADDICAVGCIEGLVEGNLIRRKRGVHEVVEYIQKKFRGPIEIHKQLVNSDQNDSLSMSWSYKLDHLTSEDDLKQMIAFVSKNELKKDLVSVHVSDAFCKNGRVISVDDTTVVELLKTPSTMIHQVYEVPSDADTKHSQTVRVVTTTPIEPIQGKRNHRPEQLPAAEILQKALQPFVKEMNEKLVDIATRLAEIQNTGTKTQPDYKPNKEDMVEALNAAVKQLHTDEQNEKMRQEKYEQGLLLRKQQRGKLKDQARTRMMNYRNKNKASTTVTNDPDERPLSPSSSSNPNVFSPGEAKYSEQIPTTPDNFTDISGDDSN